MKQIILFVLLCLINLTLSQTNTNNCEEGKNGCAVCDPTDKTKTKCKYCRKGYAYNAQTQTCTICEEGEYSYGGQSQCSKCNDYGICSQYSNGTLKDNGKPNYDAMNEKDWKCPFYSYNQGSEKCRFCETKRHTNMGYSDCYTCPSNC